MYEFNDSKYTTWYFDIINSRKTFNRTKHDGQVYENHHIIPKCLGGTDNQINMVLLTPREHFIVHLLLIRMVSEKDIYKMISAIARFSNAANSSRTYNIIRLYMSNYSKGKYNYAYGRKWAHDTNTKEIYFIKSSEIDNKNCNIKLGLPYQRGGHRGTVAINNGAKETYVPKFDVRAYTNAGWQIGRLNAPKTDHMKKMTERRHTQELDREHASKLRGRVAIRHKESGKVLKVHKHELDDYLNSDYIIATDLTTAISPECIINGVHYKSYFMACNAHSISKSTLYYRLTSDNKKWKEWVRL